MNHTPGPWKVGKFVDYLSDSGTIEISDEHGPHWVAHALTEDNARLIAAAPDLLEACIEIAHEADRVTGHNVLVGKHRFQKVLDVLANLEIR